jgi:hypothetical protein
MSNGKGLPSLRQKVTGGAPPWWARQGIPGQSPGVTPVAGATIVAPSRHRERLGHGWVRSPSRRASRGHRRGPGLLRWGETLCSGGGARVWQLLCMPKEEHLAASDRLLRPAFRMCRMEWPGDAGGECHLVWAFPV